MKKVSLAFAVSFIIFSSYAQEFISKASIEYEVKTNIKKTMGTGFWEDMMKDKMPDFKTAYYTYTFANNQSIYKFDHWNVKDNLPQFAKQNAEDNIWFFDFNAQSFSMQKSVYGSNFYVQDSIPEIKWKLSNESRVIAGFNCRKAVGVILDSVYVFAFYSNELMIPGGPCSISGLPGAILGLTIPRLYTSWIATQIMVNDIKVSSIKAPTAKKYYTYPSLVSTIQERSKEWGNPDDPESYKWVEQFRWNVLL